MDEEIKMLNEAAWERIKRGKSLTDEEIIEKVRRLEEKMLNGEYLREERSKVKAYRSKEGGANGENKSAARDGKLIRFAPVKPVAQKRTTYCTHMQAQLMSSSRVGSEEHKA